MITTGAIDEQRSHRRHHRRAGHHHLGDCHHADGLATRPSSLRRVHATPRSTTHHAHLPRRPPASAGEEHAAEAALPAAVVVVLAPTRPVGLCRRVLDEIGLHLIDVLELRGRGRSQASSGMLAIAAVIAWSFTSTTENPAPARRRGRSSRGRRRSRRAPGCHRSRRRPGHRDGVGDHRRRTLAGPARPAPSRIPAITFAPVGVDKVVAN